MSGGRAQRAIQADDFLRLSLLGRHAFLFNESRNHGCDQRTLCCKGARYMRAVGTQQLKEGRSNGGALKRKGSIAIQSRPVGLIDLDQRRKDSERMVKPTVEAS